MDDLQISVAPKHAEISAAVLDPAWHTARKTLVRGEPPPKMGRHPTRHTWEEGVGQGNSWRTAANVATLNTTLTRCGSKGCCALVQVNTMRRASGKNGYIPVAAACTARCHRKRIDPARFVLKQSARIDAVLSSKSVIIKRPRTRDQRTAITLSPDEAASALHDAVDAALIELQHAPSLLKQLAETE